VREIRMLRVMWRELETELRLSLLGHEGGNSGHGQGTAYRVTAPALDPTRQRILMCNKIVPRLLPTTRTCSDSGGLKMLKA
jgi:hypothetical protein